MIRPRSISTKMLLWFVSTLFLILVGLSLSFYFYMHNFLYTNAEHLIRDKNFAVGGWIDYRIKDMNFQVNSYLQSQEASIFIQVTDLKRRVIGKTDNLKEALPLSPNLANKVFKLDNVVLTKYYSPTYGNMLIANGTGLTNNKILGFVQVAIQEKEITKTLDNVIHWILISIPILLLLSFLLGKFLTKKMLAPFALITESAQKISFNELNSQRLPVVHPQDELGRLTITINDLLNRLNEAITSQKQFVADAAHELRTPLSIIQGEIEVTLRDKANADDYKQVLISNLEEVHRLTAITDSLIMLTRLDANKENISKEKLDITALCQGVVGRFARMLESKQLVCEIMQKDVVEVIAIKAFLEQVIINLIDNAIKYSNSNSSIQIYIERNDSYYAIRVKDAGIGIPNDELPYIFNRFYRVDKSRSNQIKGSGLGLAIVKSIIELHGGTIEVKSQEGKGSEFILMLP